MSHNTMRAAAELTTRLSPSDGNDEGPTSEILINGQSAGAYVPGAVLEAAVQWRDFYLLLMTDDIPHEDVLRILLLDGRLRAVDRAWLGGPYSTGTFSDLRFVGPDAIAFRFIGDTLWRVELLPHRKLRIPFLSEPRGVWRAFGFTRHFIVHGQPCPASA